MHDVCEGRRLTASAVPANVNVVTVVGWLSEVPRVVGVGVPCVDELGWPQLPVSAREPPDDARAGPVTAAVATMPSTAPTSAARPASWLVPGAWSDLSAVTSDAVIAGEGGEDRGEADVDRAAPEVSTLHRRERDVLVAQERLGDYCGPARRRAMSSGGASVGGRRDSGRPLRARPASHQLAWL